MTAGASVFPQQAHASHNLATTPTPQAIAAYSADAMRWALADAGDALDDANFESTTANAAILRLTKELAWIEEVLSPSAGGGVCAACLKPMGL